MKLLITGLSHHTAPVEVRERLAFEEQALPGALDRLCQRPGMVEGMILSTCNRVEVAVTAEESSDAANSVDEFLAEARMQQGDKFDLKAFHDFVWKNGNVPIALQRWEYIGDPGDVPKLGK